MGTNLLRYSHYLSKEVVPHTAIVSGEQNKTAETFAKREYFDALYSGIKNKYEALQHFCRLKGIEPVEVAFIFDDVLDLSVSAHCGIRILVNRESNPAFTRFVKKNNLADYLTYSSGAHNAVRESAELIMSLYGEYERAVQNRMEHSQSYSDYLGKRNSSGVKLFGKFDLLNNN
jgi:3-deoxy-D-manno-octulosonate 8-phosphate phosphatase KdsC-like HAD superfamily phosphatase